MLIKILFITAAAIIVSLYYFPFVLPFMSGMTGKTVMAGIGLALLIYQLARKHQSDIKKEMYILFAWAATVSLIGFISTTLNNTTDFSYTGYLISMSVWMAAAYLTSAIIKWVHGYLSVKLICNYLIAVCVGQCIIALLIEFVPFVREIAIAIMGPQDAMEKINRLYGIGAALDTAGSRFSAALVMIIFIVTRLKPTEQKKYMWWYLLAFVVLAVVGNMIARTTSVGVILAVLYLIYVSGFFKLHPTPVQWKIWTGLATLIGLVTIIIVYFYHTNPAIHKYIRFAFEGFFSLAEKGKWEVGSNKMLQNMYVFPEAIKTWLIGDGYFSPPQDTDPYFTGKIRFGYYMGTDVGYLRFIFYFGLVGLMAFSTFIYKAYRICTKWFARWKELFFLLLLVNFIVWFKVATDIFLVFALFLMVDKEENDAHEKVQIAD